MQFAIRHFMSGRVRLHVPALCRKRALAKSVLAWLRSQNGVRSTRINYDCASLVVEFDPAHEDMFRLLLGRLRLMTLEDLAAMIKMGAKEVGRHEAKELLAENKKPRNPLALPTLSLALALASPPVVGAVNIPLMLWNAYPIAARAYRVWKKESRLNVDFLDTLAIGASHRCRAIRLPAP